MFKSSFIWLGLLLCAGCTSVNAPMPDSAYRQVQASIPEWGAIIDLASGEQIAAEQLLEELAGASTVMIGEVHVNPVHHLIEQWLATRLAERRAQGAVVLEMLGSDQQRPVDQVRAWLAQGNQVRAKRLKQIIQWDERWSWAQYGALVESLMLAPAPLLAGNLSRAQRNQLMSAPPVDVAGLFANPAVAALQRKQIIDMHCGQIDRARLDAMLAIQYARDLRMAQVLDRSPAPRLLIAGTLHTLKSQGAPLYLQQGPTDAALKVLVMGEQGQPVTHKDADYLWLLPAHDTSGTALSGGAPDCGEPSTSAVH
ncbi:ChaN family lipoprotein [Pseudomonas auratipiscis]|uniref:ChaN family lipoprotein n=1 Tax=Pseudomonas auratipiscis TaxID=3115853 RepID=A0AB35WPY8_9PSED|nr:MULTISPECIES: ChaN family lipoprotein [unclassified Pseudomonas]MEE1866618.1 ChaN family lipoprotein [Pseudomonas sp. 120P]MEE1957393.1 ChaN family lipoprotein [Pseudomonas sp. 119P]